MMIMRGDVLTDTIFRWTKDEQNNTARKARVALKLFYVFIHFIFIDVCKVVCISNGVYRFLLRVKMSFW